VGLKGGTTSSYENFNFVELLKFWFRILLLLFILWANQMKERKKERKKGKHPI
jgi:hypothetical protein